MGSDRTRIWLGSMTKLFKNPREELLGSKLIELPDKGEGKQKFPLEFIVHTWWENGPRLPPAKKQKQKQKHKKKT